MYHCASSAAPELLAPRRFRAIATPNNSNFIPSRVIEKLFAAAALIIIIHDWTVANFGSALGSFESETNRTIPWKLIYCRAVQKKLADYVATGPYCATVSPAEKWIHPTKCKLINGNYRHKSSVSGHLLNYVTALCDR